MDDLDRTGNSAGRSILIRKNCVADVSTNHWITGSTAGETRMRQYGTYPIFINAPPETLKANREKQIAEHAAKHNFRETARLRNVQKRLDDIVIDPSPTAIATAFESEVVKHLDLVASSPIGRVTLDSLNPRRSFGYIR